MPQEVWEEVFEINGGDDDDGNDDNVNGLWDSHSGPGLDAADDDAGDHDDNDDASLTSSSSNKIGGSVDDSWSWLPSSSASRDSLHCPW